MQSRWTIWFTTMLCTSLLLAGCAFLEDSGLGQAEVTALQTREVDAPYEKVYAAAQEALFDLGYTILHSEKASGVLVGEKQERNHRSEWITIPNTTNQIPRPQAELYDTLDLTFLIKPNGPRSTNVRIKTDINKHQRLDRRAINDAWLYIQRQVMMNTPPEPAPRPAVKPRARRKR